jgi:anti-sigma regulatory factor (Ser/Thr protein kinase)
MAFYSADASTAALGTDWVPGANKPAGEEPPETSPRHAMRHAAAAPAKVPFIDRLEEGEHAVWLLPASKRAAHIARQLIQPYAIDEEAAAVTQLIVSELVTNAVKHGAPPISLAVAQDCDDLTITVHDAGTGLSQAPSGPPSLDAECGRGLMLIAAVADGFSVRSSSQGTFAVARIHQQHQLNNNRALCDARQEAIHP